MTGTKAELKGLVGKAAKVKQDHPTISIPAAMRVAKFTNKEAEDRTLQQQVCRIVSPPTKQIVVTNSSTLSTVSTLTSAQPVQLPPIKKLRLSSMQAHQKRVNDVASENNQNWANKRATTLFAEEMKKPEHERKL